MELFCKLDLSEERLAGYAAALRPYREGGPRIEVEHVGSKILAHNYGHGGSGITMAWGSSLEVLKLLEPHLATKVHVGVLGSGVMGLCTATLLQERGHPVTIYSKAPPIATTSCVAGGLWAPTHIGKMDTALNDRLLRTSWHHYRSLAPDYGVEEIPLYETLDRCHPLEPIPEDLVPPAQTLERLPFEGNHGQCLLSRTLLIETPRFLQALLTAFEARGGSYQSRELHGPDDLQQLPQCAFVNCLGMAAREFASDQAMKPIRGQLVLMKPAPKPFVLDHAQGYIISRRDLLVLGGTFEEGEENPQPVVEICRDILRKNRALFA